MKYFIKNKNKYFEHFKIIHYKGALKNDREKNY